MVEIYEKSGVYSYRMDRLELNDGYYFWTPMDDGTRSFFDTRENAIADATIQVENHKRQEQGIIST